MTSMLGSSAGLRTARARLEKFASCDEPILIEGETGTGKELAARGVHYTSPRHRMPFVPVNCGSIPDGLVENEFFGHARGGFTDARADHGGLVQLAEGGTLFLDEVDTLSVKAQVFLLRFLQDRVYRPVGSPVERLANVRIVAATNASLPSVATGGAFRSDLLFRLRVLHVRLPPLRERREDLPELARYFLGEYAARLQRPPKRLHPEVLERMLGYAWPGNIRELENMICRAFLLEDGPELRLDAFSELDDAESAVPVFDPRTCGYSEAKAAAICAFEIRYLSAIMDRAGGSVTAAAKLAGTERRHLGRLLKKHRLGKAGFSVN